MNFRTTSILFGVLLAILFLFGIVIEVQLGKLDEGYLFRKIHDTTLDVDTIEYWKDKTKYVFLKGKNGWTLTPPDSKNETWRIRENDMDSMIREVQQAQKNTVADVAVSKSKAGLLKPSIKVTLKVAGSGKAYTLFLGNKSADAEKGGSKANIFAYSSERPREIVPIKIDSLSTVLKSDPNQLRETTLLSVDSDNAKVVTIVDNKDKKKLALKKEEAGRWQFETPRFGIAAFNRTGDDKDEPTVKKLLNDLGAIRVDDVKNFQLLNKTTLADYDLLEGKELLRIEVKRDKTFSEKAEGPVEETLLIGKKAKKDYYVRLLTDNYVVRVEEDKIKPILDALAKPESLRSRDLTFIELAEPDAVVFRTGDKLENRVELLKKEATEWKMAAAGQRYTADQTSIDGTDGLLKALKGEGKIKEFFNAKDESEAKKLDAKLGFTNPKMEIAVFLDSVETVAPKEKEKKKEKEKPKVGKKEKKSTEAKKSKGAKGPTQPKKDAKQDSKKTKKGAKKKDEEKSEPKKDEPVVQLKKDAKPRIKLIFGNVKKDLVYIKRIPEKGEISRVAVPKAILEKMISTQKPYWLAFLKEELPEFNTFDAARLELTRSDGKFLLEKKTEAEKKEKKTKGKEKEKKTGEKDNEKKEVWKLLAPKDLPGRGADEGQVLSVLSRLGGVGVNKWIKKSPSPKDLLRYGLTNRALVAKVTLKGEKDEKGETREWRFGAKSKKDEGVYALVSGTNGRDIVFLTNSADVEFLKEAELRDRTVFKFDAEKVAEVKLEWNLKEDKKDVKKQITLKRKKDAVEEWKIAAATNVEKDTYVIDDLKVTTYVGEWSRQKAERYVELKNGPKGEHKLKMPALTITLKLKDGKTKELMIGAPNKVDTGYFARIGRKDWAKVVFLLSKDIFEPVLVGPSYFNLRGE